MQAIVRYMVYRISVDTPLEKVSDGMAILGSFDLLHITHT